MSLVGRTIRNRYEISKRLGSGGFGETYLAKDTDLPSDRECVVKHLQPRTSEPAVLVIAKRLFNSEAIVLDKLGKHNQIPTLYAHFEENDEFYLVQEFINGYDLDKELIPGQQLSEDEVIELLQGILEVLAFVHQEGVIHRDIKPSNLMRRQKDQRFVLIDFGAVKEISTLALGVTQGLVSPTVAVGTPGYMPREQIEGYPQLCSDVYAVGIVGIQALTGLQPKEFKDPTTGKQIWRKHVPDSKGLADILDKMVREDYTERYQTALEALQALKALQAPNKPVPPQPWKWRTWRDVVIALTGIGIGALSLLFVQHLLPSQQQQQTEIPTPIQP
ncbi:MAG: serine/threonine-protein kinase, partial [Cyanobacteriota bacterium]